MTTLDTARPDSRRRGLPFPAPRTPVRVYSREPTAPSFAVREAAPRVVVLRPSDPEAGSPDQRRPLSETELRVIRLVAQGMPDKEVGCELGTKRNTIKTHKRHIKAAFGSNGDAAHAVAFAHAHGILTTTHAYQGPQLTSRHYDVLVRITSGMTNAQIGAELYLTEDTVKTHVRRLMTTVKARSRAHAVHIALSTGLVRVIFPPVAAGVAADASGADPVGGSK